MSGPFKLKGFPLHAGTSPVKQKVQLGEVPYMKVNVSTKEGRDILNRYKNVKTIRSSDPSRVAKATKATKLGELGKLTTKVGKYGRLGVKGSIVGGIITEGLLAAHKSGQKHSGGRVRKDQKSFMTESKKKSKSIFKK